MSSMFENCEAITTPILYFQHYFLSSGVSFFSLNNYRNSRFLFINLICQRIIDFIL
ncbi:MAG: hypothetical protein IIT46_08790 [Lachnospiraceae bacterium]|nr:hypothetical protein [Lachnospiraceae bacterium]